MKGKPVNIKSILIEFQALATKIGPNFRVKDAEANHVWAGYKSKATGMKFNEVKKLAGLPFKSRAPNGQGGKESKYEPCKIKAGPRKKKQCLGILPTDKQCKITVELPARLCHRCRQRNQNS